MYANDNTQSVALELNRRTRGNWRRERDIRAVLSHMAYTPDEIARLVDPAERQDLCWHLTRIAARLSMRGWSGDWNYSRPHHMTARILLERETQALKDDATNPY